MTAHDHALRSGTANPRPHHRKPSPRAEDIWSSPNVERIHVSALRPYSKNARTHSKKQIRQIADSIEPFRLHEPGPDLG